MTERFAKITTISGEDAFIKPSAVVAVYPGNGACSGSTIETAGGGTVRTSKSPESVFELLGKAAWNRLDVTEATL